MPFQTLIPTPEETERYGLSHLFSHEHQTWTADTALPAFLIFHQECKDALYQTREDFYFHFLGQTMVASFGLDLKHEDGVLVFRWYLLSSYGLARFKSSRPAVLLVDETGSFSSRVIQGRPHETVHGGYSGADILALLKEAFTSYKTHHGFRESGTQKMIVDESRLVAETDSPPSVEIRPDGSIRRPDCGETPSEP